MLNNFAHIPQADLALRRSRSVECGSHGLCMDQSRYPSFVILEVIPHTITIDPGTL